MMIPEAWENHESMPDWKRDFYRFHAVADGAVGRPGVDRVHRRHRDRRRARPQRPAPQPLLGHRRRPRGDGLRGRRARRSTRRTVVQKGRLQPGRMFLVDTDLGPHRRRRRDQGGARRRSSPTASGSTPGSCTSTTSRPRDFLTPQHASVVKHQRVFGYTTEELKILARARWRAPAPSRSARWAPTRRSPCCPTARGCCSTTSSSSSRRSPTRRSTPSARSWSPRWAARSAPRATCSRPGPASLPAGRAPAPDHHQRRAGQAPLHQRRQRHAGLQALRHRRPVPAWPRAATGCAGRSRTCAPRSSAAIADGAKVIILSDRYSNDELAPIPSLLLTAAVHHHLIREKTRTQVGLVVECGDAREVHHMALLLGYGAGAINPYLAFETIEDMIDQGVITGVTKRQAVKNFVKASTKGVLKIMSKMGISTVASLHGRPGVRGHRPVRGARRRVLHRHHQPHQRRRPRRARRGGGRPAPLRLPRPPRGGRPPRPVGRRRVPVAPRGRAPPLQPGDGVQAPARHPHEALRHLQGVHGPRRRPGPQARHAARPVRAARTASARRCRSTRSSRSARSSSGSPPAP